MMKITPTMRRMVRDKEFFDAIAMLVEAQNRLHEIENRNRVNRRPIDSASVPLDYDARPMLKKAPLKL